MYIVGFNGPPRSGKDTLAQMLAGHLDSKTMLPVIIESLSMPMRKMAFGALGLPYNVADYEVLKDDPQPALDNMTPRQFVIDISERFMKPRFGPEIWARLLDESLKTFDGIVLIPDIGFQCEPFYFERKYGQTNVAIVQLWREGKTFDNDSRSYVATDGFNNAVENNGSLADLQTEATRIYGRMVNQWKWKL